MTSLYPTLSLDPLGLQRGEKKKQREREIGVAEEKRAGREGVLCSREGEDVKNKATEWRL